MTNPVSLRLATLCLAGMLSLTACQADSPAEPAGGPDQVSVLLDWSPNPDHLALYTAEHIGAYADEGLSVDFTMPANTADAAREVSLGRVDLAVSYEPDTLIAAAQGLDVISVASLIPTSLTSLIAKTDAGITSPADLEGKTIAISGLASQEPTLRFVANQAGFDPESMRLANVQQSLNQALLTDQADAVFGTFRNIEGVELAEQTQIVILSATDLGVPDYSELVLIANPKRLETELDYADRVRAFLKATAAGQQAALADRQLAATALADDTEGALDAEMLAKMIDATIALLPAEGFGTQNGGDWAAYASWMQANGLLDAEVDGAQVTTNEYLPAG